MRIDGANSLPPQGPGEAAESVRGPSRSGDPDTKIPADESQMRSVLAPYVRAAMAAEEVDGQAVAEARKLLQSGQLDTPEAARRAAEALLMVGI